MKILVEKSDIIWDKVLIIIFFIGGVLLGVFTNNISLIIIDIFCIIDKICQIVEIINTKNN